MNPKAKMMKYIDEFFKEYFLIALLLFICFPYSVVIAVAESDYTYLILSTIVLLLLIIHYLIFYKR